MALIENKNLFTFLVLLLVLGSCKEEYIPAVTQQQKNILVIEGFINLSGDTSHFTLSRSLQLSQTVAIKPETAATITLLNANGASLAQSIEKPDGVYDLFAASLPVNQSYRIKIVTKDGKQYESELVTGKTTPPIDSVTWKYDADKDGLAFYVSTHDLGKQSRYYQWKVEETWETHAYFESRLDYNNSAVFDRTPERQIFRCYPSQKLGNISIGNSVKLSDDIIDKAQVALKLRTDNRFNVRYSILVKQYTLTKEAYSFLQSMQKMNEQGGSIFDEQPTQLAGNYKNTADPTEAVIGFLSAATEQQKRLFVTRDQVPQSFITSYPFNCDTGYNVPNTPDSLKFFFESKGWVPIDYAPGSIPPPILAVPPECGDCRVLGGTTVKPLFW